MAPSAREVQDKTFSSSLRGYDRAEVASFLLDVARHQSHLEEELAIATARAERAQAELDRLHDVLEARLEEARRARAAILDEAREEAATIVATARAAGSTADEEQDVSAASAILAEAEAKAEMRMREVDDARADARAEAAEMIRRAEETARTREAEADRVLAEAHRSAKELRRRAEADRSEIESQLGHLRHIVEAAAEREGRALSEVNVELREGNEIIVDLTAPLDVATESAT